MYSISDHLVFWAGVRYTPPYLAKKANKKTKNLLVNLRRVGKFDCLLGVEIHSNTIIFVMCNINVLGSIRENASYSSANQEQTALVRLAQAVGTNWMFLLQISSDWFIVHLLPAGASRCRRGYIIKEPVSD